MLNYKCKMSYFLWVFVVSLSVSGSSIWAPLEDPVQSLNQVSVRLFCTVSSNHRSISIPRSRLKQRGWYVRAAELLLGCLATALPQRWFS